MRRFHPHRSPARWMNRLGAFANETGVKTISASLERELGHSVSIKSIYEWIARRRSPHLDTARALVRISGNRLTLEDILRAPPGRQSS